MIHMDSNMELWLACKRLIDNLSEIDKTGLHLNYIYEDGKIVITAKINQRFDSESSTTEYTLDQFNVFINKKLDLHPALINEDVVIGLEKRNPINGIRREKFALTQVACVKLVGKTRAQLLYYRPGRWHKYLLELSETIEKFNNQHRDLHLKPVNDSDLFSDKYKLDTE